MLDRVGKENWRITDFDKIKSPEDFAVFYLSRGDAVAHIMFDKLIDRRDGQAVRNLNHMHDKPIEMNINLNLGQRLAAARKRALGQ